MSNSAIRYEHRQKGLWHWLLKIFAAATLALTFMLSRPPLQLVEVAIPAAVSAILLITSYSFQWLTISLDDETLRAEFGPWKWLRKSWPLDELREVRIGHTSVVDGWGIHWAPGRGWTYNVWGFDCVILVTRSGRVYRLGTDEPKTLQHAIQQALHDAQGQSSPTPQPDATG